MRQLPAGLNRTWLIVIGLVLLLAGVVAALISLGVANRLLGAAGAGVVGPAPAGTVLGRGAAGFFQPTVVVVGVGVVGLVLGLLGLAWLLAQIPRVNPARTLRLHDRPAGGLTVCQPSVLSDAVETDLQRLPGVTAAAAVLRGTARQPELTVRVTANDRTDLPQLLRRIQDETAGDLSTALETPLRRLAVQVDITRTRRTSDTVTL